MAELFRYDIINELIKKHNYKRYLEIGVRTNRTFNSVICDVKEGIDPQYQATHQMTSDDFFAQLSKEVTYDVFFIDGLHEWDQVLKDLDNCLSHLSVGGTIVMHDCSPAEESWQIDKYPGYGSWNGTVWKAYAYFRMTRPDLLMHVVNNDHGVGIVKIGQQELFKPKVEIQDMNWNLLNTNREKLLNLISCDQFLELLNNNVL